MPEACSSKFRAGAKVVVTQYGGEKLLRRVVADRGGSVVVCAESAYLTAIREKRNPCGVAFPRGDVRIATDQQH